MGILAYLGLRELILNLIQRNLSLFPYSCKQTMPATVMCFLQDSSAMPHPGAAGASGSARADRGLVTQCQPWRLVLREEALSAPQCLIQSTVVMASVITGIVRALLGLSQAEGMWHTNAHGENQILPPLLCISQGRAVRGRKEEGVTQGPAEINSWEESSESPMKSVLPLCASQALYLHFSYNIILSSHLKIEGISFFM